MPFAWFHNNESAAPEFSAHYVAYLGRVLGHAGATITIVASLAQLLAVYVLAELGRSLGGSVSISLALPLIVTVGSGVVALAGARRAIAHPLPAAATMTGAAAAGLLALWIWDGDIAALILSALFLGVPAVLLFLGSALIVTTFLWGMRRQPGSLPGPVLLSLALLALIGLATFLPVSLVKADPEGRGTLAYLKARQHQRVQVYQPDAVWLRSWGSFGSGPGHFKNPSGVAILGGGSAFVVDRDNNRIQQFDGDGQLVRGWGAKGSGDGQFLAPTNMTAGPLERLYISDTGNQRVQVFDPDGSFAGIIGEGHLTEPLGIAVDGNGTLYVADSRAEKIQKFEADGGVSSWFLEEIDEPPRPVGLALDSAGALYAADYANKRIVVYDSSGNELRSWTTITGEEDKYLRPTWLAVHDDRVYVVMVARVYVFDTEGRFLQRWGSSGAGDGRFWDPQGIAVDEQGRVYVSQ
ncbi:MAG: DNA-binding beta-propeller fold protein YncE [Chloroflexi bacterium]|jgi:DNA-binding beta-propeller fold protein YncE|nr:MAG: DNA-binding beta-propeller fold protein YncE [Chloroflexota bacterium]